MFCLVLTSSTENVKALSRCSRAMMAKKCNARAKLLFCYSKRIAFSRPRCRLCRRCLSSLLTRGSWLQCLLQRELTALNFNE